MNYTQLFIQSIHTESSTQFHKKVYCDLDLLPLFRSIIHPWVLRDNYVKCFWKPCRGEKVLSQSFAKKVYCYLDLWSRFRSLKNPWVLHIRNNSANNTIKLITRRTGNWFVQGKGKLLVADWPSICDFDFEVNLDIDTEL